MTDAPPPSFRPSDVDLFKKSFAPFLDTFRSANQEIAAAMLVAALAANGDTWRPLKKEELLEWWRGRREDPQWNPILTNPVYKPDFFGLTRDGWARAHIGEGDVVLSYEFQSAAFDRMRREDRVRGPGR